MSYGRKKRARFLFEKHTAALKRSGSIHLGSIFCPKWRNIFIYSSSGGGGAAAAAGPA